MFLPNPSSQAPLLRRLPGLPNVMERERERERETERERERERKKGKGEIETDRRAKGGIESHTMPMLHHCQHTEAPS